ncbi:unnamed protein product [Effrenium voratum]|nr:unnamed protein product [Effrenium voratum]
MRAKRTYWMGNYEGDRSEYLYGQDNEYYKHTGQVKGRGLGGMPVGDLQWSGLSLVMIMAGLLIGFAVDLRYGWDINDEKSNHAYNLEQPIGVASPVDAFTPSRLHAQDLSLTELHLKRFAGGARRDWT